MGLLGRVGAGPGGQLQAALAAGPCPRPAHAGTRAGQCRTGANVSTTSRVSHQLGPQAVQGIYVQGGRLGLGQRRGGQDGGLHTAAGALDIHHGAERVQRQAGQPPAQLGPRAGVVLHAQDVAPDHRDGPVGGQGQQDGRGHVDGHGPEAGLVGGRPVHERRRRSTDHDGGPLGRGAQALTGQPEGQHRENDHGGVQCESLDLGGHVLVLLGEDERVLCRVHHVQETGVQQAEKRHTGVHQAPPGLTDPGGRVAAAERAALPAGQVREHGPGLRVVLGQAPAQVPATPGRGVGGGRSVRTLSVVIRCAPFGVSKVG